MQFEASEVLQDAILPFFLAADKICTNSLDVTLILEYYYKKLERI